MAATGRTESSRARIAGYVLAALIGIAASGLMLLIIAYVNRPYLATSSDIARCVGLGRYGWLGPILIVAIVGGLAFYLTRYAQTRSDAELAEGELRELSAGESRCLSCGQRIILGWKICPFCGSLVGKTRHPHDD